MKKFFVALALLFAFMATPVKADTVLGDIPTTPPQYGVYDPDNLLDVRVENRVRELNAKWAKTTAQPQIAVVIVNKLEGTPIEQAANTIAKNWKVGYEGTNGGILVLVDVQNHKIRTEVSDNIHKLLPTSKIDHINGAVKSNFRAERYTDGLLDYLNALDSAIASATTTSGAKSNSSNTTPNVAPTVPVKQDTDKDKDTGAGFLFFLFMIPGVIGFVASLFGGGRKRKTTTSEASTSSTTKDYGEPTAVKDYKPEPIPYTEVRSPRRSSHGMRPSVRRRMGGVPRSALVEASRDDSSTKRTETRTRGSRDYTNDFLRDMMIYHILTSNSRRPRPEYHKPEHTSRYRDDDNDKYYSSSSSSSSSSWSTGGWSSGSSGGGGGFSGGGSTGGW